MDAEAGTVSVRNREKLPISEKRLQHIWNNLPAGSSFITPTRQVVKIISPGTWNVEPGPDFLMAKIKLDDKIVTGAVEIHLHASDWYCHGHQHNSSYNNVILHAVAINDLPPEKNASLPPLVIIDWKKELAAPVGEDKFRPGKCREFFAHLTADETVAVLEAAGRERFQQKSRVVLSSVIADGAEKTTLKLLFEAMGYKDNRAQFLELWQRFNQYDPELRAKFSAAIIWGESGLLPEMPQPEISPEMRQFIERCWQEWWQIRISARPGIDWKRYARPVSSPERRIAALIALLQRYGEEPLKQFSQFMDGFTIRPVPLIKSLMIHDKLWDNYASFEKPRRQPAALLGYHSALELLVNVFLPALAATRQISCRPLEPIIDYWSKLPPTQHNRITKLAVKRWFGGAKSAERLMNTTAARQGVIHLIREFCEQCHGACESCLLYNSAASSEGQADSESLLALRRRETR